MKNFLVYICIASGLHAFDNIDVKLRCDPADLPKLALDWDRAQYREIYYFDSASLDLFEQDIVLRARVRPKDRTDSTVKVRPYPTDLDITSWQQHPGFKAETDVIGWRGVDACSLTAPVQEETIRSAVEYGQTADTLRKLFDSTQLTFALMHLKEPIYQVPLKAFGPVRAWRWKKRKKELMIEYWALNGSEDILEVSSKTSQAEEAEVQQRLRAYLHARGVKILANAPSKTRSVLESL